MPVFGPLPLTPGLPSPSSRPRQDPHSQAVHDGAPVPALCLPLVHLGQQVQEGLLGVRCVPVRGPAQELEVPHQQVALLQLGARAASQGDVSASAIRPLVTSRRSLQATQAATQILTPGLPDHSLERCSAPGRHGPPSLHPQCPTRTPPPCGRTAVGRAPASTAGTAGGRRGQLSKAGWAAAAHTHPGPPHSL